MQNPSFFPLKSEIFDLQKQRKWKELAKLSKSTEPLNGFDLTTDFTPIPQTLGCLALAILFKSSTEIKNQISKEIIEILDLLIENFYSKDLILVHYSYHLLDSCIVYFNESTLYKLLKQRIFEALSNITSENSVVLAHKLFKSRENAQRLFLKNNGYFVIMLCWTKFKSDRKEILHAISDLVVVFLIQDRYGRLNEYNYKILFTSEFLQVLRTSELPEAENFLMMNEDSLEF